MKFVLGLTGQTGAGKTTAQSIAAKNGYYVIDCDKVSREVTATNSELLCSLSDSFSSDILKPDGSLNRKNLAMVAFSRPENTEKLNNIILPIIVESVVERIKCAPNDKILLDAPTLFESGISSICNKIIAVIADTETRRERIKQRDGLSGDEAEIRIRIGKDEEFFRKKCDFVIHNDKSPGEFLDEFENILEIISEGR